MRNAGDTGRSSAVAAQVAQSVEHMHGKHEVTGSIPVLGSSFRLAGGFERAASGSRARPRIR